MDYFNARFCDLGLFCREILRKYLVKIRQILRFLCDSKNLVKFANFAESRHKFAESNPLNCA
ncbi:hypothetical protein [Helicobacter sp. 23-1045]